MVAVVLAVTAGAYGALLDLVQLVVLKAWCFLSFPVVPICLAFLRVKIFSNKTSLFMDEW